MIEKITESLKSFAISISEAHQTKLINLWRKERLRSLGIITNLSNKALIIAEQDALRFGFKSSHFTAKIQENNVKANIERFIHGLKQKTKIKLDDDFKLSFYSKNSLSMLNVQFQLAIIQLFIVH